MPFYCSILNYTTTDGQTDLFYIHPYYTGNIIVLL